MSPRRSLPLPGTDGLRGPRRRTALLRAGLAAAVVAAVAFACVAGSGGEPAAAAAGRGATVVVLDVSGSIGESSAAAIRRQLAATIRGAGPDGHVGLVLFSDTAYEALPPSAPGSALAAYRRFYVPRHGSGSKRPSVSTGLASPYPPNPWDVSFSGGTAIARGLHAARVALDLAGMRTGRVLLLSDLMDADSDATALRRELAAYARTPGLRLSVRALPGFEPWRLTPYRLALGPGVVRPAKVPPPPWPHAAPRRPLPVGLLLAAVLAAAALSAFALVAVPLRWRPAETS